MKTPEEKRAYQRAWYAANRERARQYTKKYLAKNPEKAMEMSRKWREKHPGYYTTPERRALRRACSQNHKLRKYGLTRESWDALLRAQENKCAICSRELFSPWDFPERRGRECGAYSCACVDHDHETGKVRAILCRNCNMGIGALRDSSRIAFLAASYLQAHGKA